MTLHPMRWGQDGLILTEIGRPVTLPWCIVALMYWRMRVCGMDYIDAALELPAWMVGSRSRINLYIGREVAAEILRNGQAWIL